jgi:hypothetical protein
MPFNFLRRKKGAGDEGAAPGGAAGAGSAASSGPGVPFDGLTEDWRLRGSMRIEGRLSDALNRRDTITLSDVEWAPIDGSGPMEPAPGIRSIDPYDLIAVLSGPDTMPELSDEQRAARRVRKDPYQVALQVPPYRIVGTMHVFPGTDPRQMLEQTTEMFVPLTDAVAFIGDARVTDPDEGVVLVNRLYVRGVEETGS